MSSPFFINRLLHILIPSQTNQLYNPIFHPTSTSFPRQTSYLQDTLKRFIIDHPLPIFLTNVFTSNKVPFQQECSQLHPIEYHNLSKKALEGIIPNKSLNPLKATQGKVK